MLKYQEKPIGDSSNSLEILWRKTHVVWIFLCAVVAIMCVTQVHAQLSGQGQIQGVVTDQSGAAVPNVNVTATNVQTGVNTARQSSDAGYYVLSGLQPGLYTVTVAAPGFLSYRQENLRVDALQVLGLNISLKVGSTQETVTVTSAPPALETENAALGATMEHDTYSALPINMGSGAQRDPTAFVFLMPGVTGGGRSGIFNGAGGSNGYLDEMYVEGMPITSGSQQGDNRGVSLAVSLEAVDQFQVQTSGSNPSLSGMGAQNYTIKSGTNHIHGSVYDFVRNTAFDSWDFFAKAATVQTASGATVKAPKPSEHMQEMGFTLSGPLMKNKMFLFLSAGHYRYTYGGNPGLMTVPTKDERNGDFSASGLWPIYDPTTQAACTAAQKKNCAYQFTGVKNGVSTPNVIPASRISSISQYMQQWLPSPTNSDFTNNLLSGHSGGNTNWELTERFDYDITPSQRISIIGNAGRRGFIGYNYGADAVLPLPYMQGRTNNQLNANGIVEHLWTISSTLINQFKFGYVRQWGPTGDPTSGIAKYEAASGVGIGNLPAGEASNTFPGVSFSGGQYGYDTWYSQNGYDQVNNTFSLKDQVQWIYGRHNVTAGFDLQWLQINQSNWDSETKPLSLTYSRTSTANFQTNSSLIAQSGDPYASFLIGAVNSTGLSYKPFDKVGARYRPVSPYISDDFKVNPRLTVNLGLRWDLFPPYRETANRWSFFNPALTNALTGTPGAMQYAGSGAGSCHCTTPVQMYYKNFGPRVGFAYALDNKTVVRGAYGIMYSHGGGVGGRSGANYGTGQTGLTSSASFTNSLSGEQPAFYLNPGYGNSAFPSYDLTPTHSSAVNTGNYVDSTGKSYTTQGVSYADPVISGRAPYAENWNIGIQRALTEKLVVSVNYSASASHFLASSSNNKRGAISNALDPKYLVIGQYLGSVANSTDKSTGKTYLQDAQARYPGIALPYSNFGTASTATVAAALRPYPQYGSVSDTWGNVANANYNSLQLTLSQRSYKGLSFTVNYTYSKSIDDAGTFRSGYAIPASAMDDGSTWPIGRIDRSLSTSDYPQRLSVFGVYELPFGAGKIGSNQRLVRVLAGGWALSGIYSYSSGGPLAITGSGCVSQGQGTCMPSYNASFSGKVRKNGSWGHGYLANMSNAPAYIDYNAFKAPAGYKIGNLARSAPYGLRGPNTNNTDASIRRSFDLWKERSVKFLFQADVFNVANHTRLGGIGTSFTCSSGNDYGVAAGACTGSGSLGQVTETSNSPRDWQFSGKITF